MILTIATSKGGSGKSSTAAVLLQAATARGYEVLGVDLDPQCNLTAFLAGDPSRPGTRDAMHGADDVIQTTAQNIDLMAGCSDLAAEVTTTGSAMRLRRVLDPIRGRYDLIIVDTPPTAGELVLNALAAADELLIPMECDTSNLQGLYQIADIVQQMGRAGPRIAGSVVTRYDRRPKINRYLLERIREAAADAGAPLIATIRQCIAIREAQAMQVSLFDYAPRCTAAQDYEALLSAIMKEVLTACEERFFHDRIQH